MTKLDLKQIFATPGRSDIRFNVASSVKELSPVDWNRIAKDAAAMMEWEYFYILEQSNCVSPQRRFKPFFITVFSNNELIGIAPLFERDDAAYEFGISGLMSKVAKTARIPFDRGLVGTIPFTPVPAYTFLMSERENKKDLIRAILKYIDYICEIYGFLSVRFYFVDYDLEDAYDIFFDHGYVQLVTNHYLWVNKFSSFEDFLNSIGSKRKRNIRREIKKLAEENIKIRIYKGTELDSTVYDKMYGLYLRTWKKYMPIGVRPFLNRKFFALLKPFFAERCLFTIATREQQEVGMAIFFEKEDRLFGRYWGAYEEIPFLHFAACYYLPMEYAIENKIKHFDPGFGGLHKKLRGFKSIPTYHYIKFFGPDKHLGYMALESVLDQWGAC